MRQLYIICYDIHQDRHRTKISEYLASYGRRINLSVFECLLRPSELKRIEVMLARWVDPERDSIAIYPICRSCEAKIRYLNI